MTKASNDLQMQPELTPFVEVTRGTRTDRRTQAPEKRLQKNSIKKELKDQKHRFLDY